MRLSEGKYRDGRLAISKRQSDDSADNTSHSCCVPYSRLQGPNLALQGYTFVEPSEDCTPNEVLSVRYNPEKLEFLLRVLRMKPFVLLQGYLCTMQNAAPMCPSQSYRQ